ncbi:MAG: PcfJ domain-containing protein [Lachnospiraceae bacterium]|nr:PcfJ domain-containing protein [Lachnospiraceae bacterium]
MFRLFNNTEANAWYPDYVDIQMIYNEAEKIKHTKGQDICIIFEEANYFELVIYNEWVASSFGRFIFAKDYYWTDEEEIKFSSFVKEECVAYNHRQVRKLYDRFSLEFPEWNLKFRTDKPLRMFEQIHHCMQIGSVKETLYKAGLDEFAANLEDIEDYNLIGSSPSEIFSGLSIRLLRAINCEGGTKLIDTEEKREKLLFIQNRYSWLFDKRWNESMCAYMNKLLCDNEEYENIVRKFRKHYKELKSFWIASQYYVYIGFFNIKECVEWKLGKKLSEEISEDKVTWIYDVLIKEREYWNSKLLESNEKRNKDNEFSDEKYGIAYPKNIEEFVIESIVQHNCLMFYLDNYVDNHTDIMFLRKAECKEEAYVTVEIYEGKIIQASLKYNEEPDREVMEWLEMYARKKGFEVELEVWE